jgi:hypothetical protein
MWCVLLILPKDSEETRLSNKLHHPDSMAAMLEEAKERQAAGHLVVGVIVLEAVGLENDKLLQLEAAMASPSGLTLPASCLGGGERRRLPFHLAPGTAGQVTAAANALARPTMNGSL